MADDSAKTEMADSNKPDANVRAPELYEAAKANDASAVLSFLKDDVSPRYIDELTGWTALHWAAKHGNVKMMKSLLDYGASEPYHLQVQRGESVDSKEALKIFAKSSNPAYADKSDEDDEDEEEVPFDLTKNTPLLWAAFKGHLRIVWLLLIDGYSPNDVDNLGNNAVHLAAACAYRKVLQCLLDDGGNANAVNTYKNIPLDMATDPVIRDMLTVAMEKGASMTSAAISMKHDYNLKTYFRMTNDLKSAVAEANKVESPRAYKSLGNFPQIVNVLSDALQDAREWCLDEDLIAEGERLMGKVELTQELYRDISNLQSHSPLRSQAQYVTLVHTLEATIERAALVGVDPSQLQLARDLIVQSQIEYWLSVRIERLKGVERADESNEHDMNCLRRTIQKANSLHANEHLTEQATSLLKRLDCELEIFRAIAAIPNVRLPPPPSEPVVEGYWQDEDIGHIKETEGFPLLPPDCSEYVWEHSRAFVALAACIDRLRNCTLSADTGTNPAAVAEVKERLMKVEKDMKILEAKDLADKQVAVEAAVKAAKKLKKGKKKGSPGKKKSK